MGALRLFIIQWLFGIQLPEDCAVAVAFALTHIISQKHILSLARKRLVDLKNRKLLWFQYALFRFYLFTLYGDELLLFEAKLSIKACAHCWACSAANLAKTRSSFFLRLAYSLVIYLDRLKRTHLTNDSLNNFWRVILAGYLNFCPNSEFRTWQFVLIVPSVAHPEYDAVILKLFQYCGCWRHHVLFEFAFELRFTRV